MDAESPLPERKKRKSVAFTDEQIVFDADGSVTKINAMDESKEPSAVSHTPRTPPLSAALSAFADPLSEATADDAADGVPDLSTMKKKKSKPATADDGADDGALDLSMKKKKKKAKAKEVTEDDDFAARLKALEVKESKDEEAPEDAAFEEGDMEAGTGIWAHDETQAIGYEQLLKRFYHQINVKNPDFTLSGTRSYKIPPPQCMREGNKKTIFANLAEICKRMKRSDEHVSAFLFAELGTSGSVDGSRRLVIKGRFQQKQIEQIIRKYIIEYVTCKTCKSPDTELSKGENRLNFITCLNCGSRRSVTAIKTGFSAQVGKRRKMQG